MASRATLRSQSLPIELLTNLTLRELRSKFKRSALGWLWSIINPLSLIAIYGVVFGIILSTDPPVGNPSGLDNYAMFLVCGLLPWTYLANGLSGSAGSIVANEGLVKKVFFPRWVLPASSVLSWLASFGVEMVVLAVVLAGFGNVVLTSIPMVVVVMLIQTVYIFGLGMLLSGANAFFRDVQHFLGIALNVWFYATPILIPASVIPEQYEALGFTFPLHDLFALNPMAAFVDAYRALLYDQRGPTLSTMIEISAWAVVVVVVGVALFRKLEPRLAEEL